MYTATLRCGRVLSYEASSFLPSVGEVVPCRRHGYCIVSNSDRGLVGHRGHFGRRAKPRSQRELVEWLRRYRATTVHALRRQRFTLRMLAEVEADLGVDVDLTTGRVSVHASDRGSVAHADSEGDLS